ncbi:hypothetical protein ACIA8O_11830 [Kitasatospora sp. NPDC051853]|uniref:hypothetical protein n=1 Tax=Kitasatospora sp. NPDC051853 TaxID=3364058 RepID=UPI0037B34454
MSVVEFYPQGHFGLHWEAVEQPEGEEGDVHGLVVAATQDRRIAVAHISNPWAVVIGTRAELAALRDALSSDRLDYLLADAPNPPTR